MSKTVRTLAVTSLMLSLIACAFRPSDDQVHTVFVWHCQNASSFAVYFDTEGAAVISAAGQKYVLPQVRSGSGARYAKGDVEFWEHQGKATLRGAAGGPYLDCVHDAR